MFGPSWRELYDEAAAPQRDAWWRQRRDELLALAHESARRATSTDLRTVRERARVARASAAVDRWFYAIKANPHPEILRALGDGRLRVRMRLAWRTRRRARRSRRTSRPSLLFTPNFAPREEYAAALRRRRARHARQRCIRWRTGASCSRARDSTCASISASAAAITTRSRPAARSRSSASRWTSSTSSARSRASMAYASSACTRTWAPASSTPTHWRDGVRAARQPRRDVSARVDVARHRRRPRRAAASGRGAARSRRARRSARRGQGARIRNSNCGWSPAAIWSPTPACCWRA